MVVNMRIYEIGTGYTPIPAQISAATEIVVEELTKAMLKQNVPVEIIDIATDNRAETTLPIREVKVAKIFTRTDIQLGIMHKLKRVAYSVALAGEIKKLLKQTQERVVLHFHNQYNLFFFLKLVPKKLRTKCLIAYTNHSGIWRLPWDTVRDTIQKRYFQEAECMKQADLIFLLNEQTKQNVMQQLNVPEDRIVVINNGVNTDIYTPLSSTEKELAKQAYCLTGCQVILQVGSVYENKGQLRAVEHLATLMKKYPNFVYAYVGGIVDEDYQKQILDYAKENALESQVRYLGMVLPGKQLNLLYNTAKATILLSKYEGFSLVSIESCAAGIPVLLDRNGPVQVGSGSIPYDCDELCDVIEPLLTDETDQLGMQARENAVQNYSWNKIAGDYLTSFAHKL